MTMTEPSIRHTKSARAFFKAVTGDGIPDGTFSAIVAVFNNIDLGGDRLLVEAFDESLADWVKSGDPIPIIFSHQWDDLYAHVGSVDPNNVHALRPGDSRLPAELMALGGLLVENGEMDLEAPGEAGSFAKTLWGKLKRRAIKEFSFAYEIPPGGARPTKDAMDLVKVGLIEVGPTLKGMNPATALLNAKAARKAIDGLSPQAALELLDDLVPVPRSSSSSKAAPAERVKRLPTGSRPEGAVEDILDTVGACARVWGMTKYGSELYAVHLEGTFLEAGKCIITAERWSDPYGEGPVWELSYSLDDAGALITEAKELEVSVSLTGVDITAAKRRAKVLLDRGFDRKTALWLTFLDAEAVEVMYGDDAGELDDPAEVSTIATSSAAYPRKREAKAEDPIEGKAEEPSAATSPTGVLLTIEELELNP